MTSTAPRLPITCLVCEGHAWEEGQGLEEGIAALTSAWACPTCGLCMALAWVEPGDDRVVVIERYDPSQADRYRDE